MLRSKPAATIYPGQLNIKFLKFDTASASQQHTLEFAIIKGDFTVGALIDVAKDANIYKFVFLAYTGLTDSNIKVWKGCRDFMYVFLLYCRQR